MKPVETIWFENINVFSEPVLSLGPVRASMKQLLYTLLALALVFSLLNFVKQPLLAVPIAGLLLLFAYAKPYGQNFEVLLIDMVSFFKRKKEIGEVTDKDREDIKKVKVKDKDKIEKEKEKEKEREKIAVSTDIIDAVTVSPTTTIITDTTTTNTDADIIVPNVVNSKSNLLHYIVPKHKDFDLEVTDNELIVVTGSSTIHIPSSSSKVRLMLEIDNREIVRIVVNET